MAIFIREGVDTHLSWGIRGTFPGEAQHCGSLSRVRVRVRVRVRFFNCSQLVKRLMK